MLHINNCWRVGCPLSAHFIVWNELCWKGNQFITVIWGRQTDQKCSILLICTSICNLQLEYVICCKASSKHTFNNLSHISIWLSRYTGVIDFDYYCGKCPRYSSFKYSWNKKENVDLRLAYLFVLYVVILSFSLNATATIFDKKIN